MRLKLCHLAREFSQWLSISNWAAKQKTAKSTLEILRYHQKVLNYIATGDNDNIYNPKLIKSWVPAAYLCAGFNVKVVPGVQVKLVCGMDMLKSIATSGLYTDEEVSQNLIRLSRYAHNKILYDNVSF